MENEEIIFIDELEEKQSIKEENNKTVKTKKQKKKKSLKKWIVTFGLLDVIAVVCLFLMYGPFPYFRNLWVTSALTTATHEYFAYIFFDAEEVQKIMANNVVIEGNDSSKEEDIEFSGEDTGVYESIYEEQILKRDEGNDLYKVIDIEGDGYKGHMLVVYDPSRIDLVQAPNLKYGGKQLAKLLELNDGIAGINASGFNYSKETGYIPNGIVIMDNEIVWGADKEPAKTGGIIGFTNDNKLILTKSTAQEALDMGIRDAVTFGPFLVVNGVPSEFKGNGGYGIAPRTAIGQRRDGIVLMLVIDGRRPGHSLGVDMVELTNVLLKYGAYNAANLDGGGSSSIVVEGEILSVAGGWGYTGERYIPNAIIIK
ncbi:MAG: phosphodiester glycosidase family protein [Firmicutes bacterium]|nr:phosphodiester glycosidase family protein [Bacillota bacterium]